MGMRENKNNGQKTIREFFFCKNNLTRDVIIILISIGLAALLTTNHHKFSYQQTKKQNTQPAKKPITKQVAIVENEAENSTMDTTNWKLYQTQWYGFELKYPKEWNNPILKNAAAGAKWEQRYQFRKSSIDESNPYIGFDVVVYNVNKVKELSNTDEFPTIKNEELKNQGICNSITGRVGENENYSAEQVYIDQNDDCYNATYFYTLTRDNYIYNIVPIVEKEKGKLSKQKKR